MSTDFLTSMAEFEDFCTQPASLSDRSIQQRGLKVLVVDDNPVNLLIASGLLEFLGHEVCTASDAPEAIALCATASPDLVLMDLQMPGMGGCEAARKLREMQGTGVLQAFSIIAASAEVDDGIRQECRDAGMDQFVLKPLNLARLRTAIDRASHPHSDESHTAAVSHIACAA